MRYDFVIVGGGSAGCVLANRLSAHPDTRVLLLEAGGEADSLWIKVPVGFQKLLTHPRFNWLFEAEPDPNVNARQLPIPRGKGLGGSSAINGMLYVRGQPLDYDVWSQLGNRGWSFADVLPYFKKAERFERGGDRLRGGEGPLNVADMREHHELVDAFIAAGVACGYPHNPDYNGDDQTGFGYYQVTQANGRRESAADAFLHPVRHRPNLQIITHAHATRLLLDGKRVVGVVYDRNGTACEVRADRSVCLTAGAVQSPQLLELSGIGDPARLQALGIEVNHALAGVGENYRDHYAARINWRVNKPITLNQDTRGLRMMREIVRYAIRRRGVLTYTAGIGHGFIHSRPGLETPDCQLFFAHGSFSDVKTRAFDREPGMTIGVYQCRPESQGAIHIHSRDPFVAPRIVPNFLSNPMDCEVLLGGMREVRRIGEADPLARYCEFEMNPGAKCRSDEELLDYARSTGATTYHVMGTCKMGTKADRLAVVDERLAVHGLEGLRVADASIMPTMPSGNINAPVIMIAEKAADMILRDA